MAEPLVPLPLPKQSVDDPSFVGRGFRFPFTVDSQGGLALTNGVDDLDSSMRIVLSTAPGERVMRSQFGCKIWDLLFEPVNRDTIGLMIRAVREALDLWEPRAQVETVDVVPDPQDSSRVDIHVRYIVKTTNDRRNLVYPFYVIPREEA